jgi:hypothetical protein
MVQEESVLQAVLIVLTDSGRQNLRRCAAAGGGVAVICAVGCAGIFLAFLTSAWQAIRALLRSSTLSVIDSVEVLHESGLLMIFGVPK